MAELNGLTINGSNYTFEDDVARGLAITEKNRAQEAEQSLQTAINNKVDKVTGKGLSTNDYTNEEKAKLAELENYDDTQVRQLINEEKAARQQGDNALSESVTQEETRAKGVEQTLQLAIDVINGKMPAQATAQNQLADKEFVNSSISTATADFKGTYNSLQELEQVTANANDYAFVIATDAVGNTVYKRYKWAEGTGWSFEYDLNNSSFTAAQWAAIQSGITAALVIKLTDLPTNAELNQRIGTAITTALGQYYTKSEIDEALGGKQNTIDDLANIRSGAQAGSTAVQPSTLNEVVKNTVAESGVYDISANNDNIKFESLSALLSSANLNTLIPTDIRKGGMSIKFVLSSDNKYLQYRYTAESIESADFTNEANWELDVTKKNLSEDFLGLLSEIKDFTTATYSIQVTGKFGTNNIYNHAIIPVNEGEIYYLIGTRSSCRAAFATSNSSSSGADIPLVNGTSVIPMPATGQYYKLVIPAGCTYLLFNAGEYYGSRLFRHYNSIDEATEILKKSIEDVDSKLPRLSFIGKVIDWTSHYEASFGPLAGSFLAGHKYRAWIKNPNDISQQNRNLDGFTIFAYNNPNQERDTQNKIRITCFTTVKVNQTVEAYYDFELPTEATVTYQDVEVTVTGVQEWWLQAYGRANDGVEIDIRIEDISLLTVIDDNLDSTDSTHALSAKQGSVLNDKIHNTDVSLEELSTEILGGYIIEDTISKDNITKSEIGASMGTTDWAKNGSAASLVIGLADYKAEGFNYLHITPQEKESYNTYITFTKIALPESNVSSAVLMSTYLSSGMGGALRLKYDSNSGDNQVAIPDDAMYVYIEKRFRSDNGNTDRLPDDYSITKEFYNESIIDQKIKESLHNTIGMAVSPTPPAVTNIKINENGSIVKQDNIFTTAMIFGDFACKLRDGYDINRIMKCDTAGNIVNYNYATDTLPNAVMDGAGYEGHKNRRVYGTSFKSLEYGIIIEIKSDGSNVQIAPSDVFEYFYWKGTLTSELETLPRYNGNSYTDSAIDADRVFTKNSIQSALKRARIAAMIPWITQRYVMPTQEAWRDIQFLQGTVQHGAPYSRANVRERWLGIDVSPETFITASMNPYSVLYTEKIGDGTAANPFASEYGITEYGSNHGVPYYGLVCSAYASYILGFNEPAATDGFPNDSRLYVISKHSEIESGCTEAPVDARTIPALSCITTPGHTYMVIDFLQVEGERVAAIVAEETSPMIRVGLYPIDRLQERWDYEYQYYCTESGGYTGDENVIEVTLIKPSSLDERKDNSVWDVSQMYSINTNKDVMLGICRQDMKIDSNVMFYMGENAVVMEYDDVKAIKNDRQWLVIKPETYTKVQVEKWDESNNQWVIITSSYDIATNKESYSDNNTDYFKIDVTSVCSTYGIYRACLVNGNEHTGYTQWMVLNCLIKKDPNNNNRIIWESANSELSIDSVNYAKAVAVRNTLSNGAGSTVNSEVYAARGYIIINPDTADYLKVSLQCKWGIATRFTRYQLL